MQDRPRQTSGDGAASAGRTVSDLIARVKRGDRASCGVFVERMDPLLMAYVERALGNSPRVGCDPGDVVNDAWARILPRIAEIQPADGRLTRAFLKYAATVIHNRIRDLVKTRHEPAGGASANRGTSSVSAGPTVEPTDGADGVVSIVVRREALNTLRRAIDSLPARDRAIVLLRGIGQKTNDEVAADLGIRAGTVAVRYHRALDRLRRLLPLSAFEDLFAEDT
jgi:RNA polymerase sigma-70 factor (ECF subfamily)